MEQLSKIYKSYLTKLSRELQRNLKLRVQDSRLHLKPIKVYPSDTYGWVTDILHLRRIPGTIQLWLDLFPNVGRPVLSICYNNGDIKRVRKVAEAFTNKQYLKPDLSTNHCGTQINGCAILAKPLQKKYFGKPLVESYQSNFFSMYLTEQLRPARGASRNLIRKLTYFSEKLFRATASALESYEFKKFDYAGFENRKIVSKHIRRERSQKLALIAKTRDGFTCRICQFNFADTYGELGRGFVEAHHCVPLSKLKGKIQTSVEDLITVCANCHRILHRMSGEKSDVKRLKQMVRPRKYKRH